MRKIISFLVTTVDGYYEGPNQEFDEFGLRQIEEVDTPLFGQVTYQPVAR